MKYSRTRPWLSAFLALAGCSDDPKPPEPEEARLERVVVECAPSALVLGQSTQCRASAFDQKGEAFTVPAYTWTSGDAALAQVDASGQVRSQGTGTVAIRASATSAGTTRQGEASVTVSARPATVHATSLAASETWRLADSPHEVRGQLSVSNGATLTLEPGVVVLFAPDAELRVAAGALLAPGTATQPVTLVAPDASAQGAWRGLVFAAEGSASRLEHVTLRGCGQPSGEGACLTLRDKAAPVLLDVSVHQSGSLGVRVADDGSAFGPGSARLAVSGGKGFALSLNANHADSLPTASAFSGNGRDAVLLTGSVVRSLTWPHPGVPFVINHPLFVNAEDVATLTLTPGTTLRFGPEGELFLGNDTQADLIAEGTASAPILLTSDTEPHQPGQWRGLHLRYLNGYTRLLHTTIEYAGTPGGLNGETGNLNLNENSSPPLLQHVTLRFSGGHGIEGLRSAGLANDSMGLVLEDNGGYPLTIASSEVDTIPRDTVFARNHFNAVLTSGKLYRSLTWPNLGLPYVIEGALDISHWRHPTLTLEPGTELRFNADSEITIGKNASDQGALVARGTAAAPILFVPNTASPVRQYWKGLHLWWSAGSAFEHVLVSYAGGVGYRGTANVNIYRNPAPSITHSHFNWAGGCAILTSNKTSSRDEVVSWDYSKPEFDNHFYENSANLACSY